MIVELIERSYICPSILECAELRLYRQALFPFFYASDNTCVDVEAAAYFDNLFCMLGAYVYLHTMAHVEYLVHFFPVCATLFTYDPEERRNWEHIVLNDMTVVSDKVEHFGLGSSSAVYHSVYLRTKFIKYALDDWGISSGGREYKASCCYGSPFDSVVKVIVSAVYEFVRHGMVVAFGIFLCKVLCEHIMARTCKSVAAHTSIVTVLVCCLSG